MQLISSLVVHQMNILQENHSLNVSIEYKGIYNTRPESTPKKRMSYGSQN